MLASGSADNTIKLWNVETGQCLKTWEFPTAVKRVAFSEDDAFLLGVTEKRMGYPGSIVVFPVKADLSAQQVDEPSLTMTTIDSKVTMAGWSYLNKFILAGHENGTVSQYDAKTGERLKNVQAHTATITDLQMSIDGSFFVTASKDKTAKIIDVATLDVKKTYATDTPLNCACLVEVENSGLQEPMVLVGGGQEARDVTTTSAREGKFESRVYSIYGDELGRIRGHFGPLNTIAASRGSFASGGEDGYVRVHHYDDAFKNFKYRV
jgi:translation initiation factor 3 subunit I